MLFRLVELPESTFQPLARAYLPSYPNLARWEQELLLTDQLGTLGELAEAIRTAGQDQATEDLKHRERQLSRWEALIPNLVGTTVSAPVGHQNRAAGHYGWAAFTISSYHRDKQGSVDWLTLRAPGLRDVKIQRNDQRRLHYYIPGEYMTEIILEPLLREQERLGWEQAHPLIQRLLAPLLGPDVSRYTVRAM